MLCVVRVHVHISIHGLLNTHIAVTLCAGFLCCIAMDALEKTFNMFKLPNELEQSLQKNLNGIDSVNRDPSDFSAEFTSSYTVCPKLTSSSHLPSS